MSFKPVELDSNNFLQKNNFENIPYQFRDLCKRYIATLISVKPYSDKYINTDIIKSLEIFFNYISATYPNWTDIKPLNRLDMEFSYMISITNMVILSKKIEFIYSALEDF